MRASRLIKYPKYPTYTVKASIDIFRILSDRNH